MLYCMKTYSDFIFLNSFLNFKFEFLLKESFRISLIIKIKIVA